MLWKTCGCRSDKHFAQAHSLSQSKHTWSGSLKAFALYARKPCPLSSSAWSANRLSWIHRNYLMGAAKVRVWVKTDHRGSSNFLSSSNDVVTFDNLFRNKEEIYFIASELLKKICSSRKGIDAVRKSPALLRRLHNLVEELSRKAHNEKRFDFTLFYYTYIHLYIYRYIFHLNYTQVWLFLPQCRNVRGPITRENTDRRLREAVIILRMVTEG